MSPGRDGGVSGFYKLGSGWSASYPETTGYIICSFIDQGLKRGDENLLDRARRMLDWLVEIQFPEGGFQSGLIDAARPVPVTFNTGQILLGLARGAEVFGNRYHDAMGRAANWLVETQDADGCWRSAPTPLAAPGDKAYETHVSWGLFEAARVAGRQSWGAAGLRQVRWAVSKLQPNGWMADCCLSDSQVPLTHTLGYALKGIVEAYRFSNDRFFLDAAVRFADGLAGCIGQDGYLAGRLRRDWSPAVNWACVTGSSQIAWSLMFLGQNAERARYQALARKLNQFVRGTMLAAGDADVVGGVRGSFPLNGEYFPFAFPNWAAKFTLDANQFELETELANNLSKESNPAPLRRKSVDR
ncbi:hypothetical protein IVA95_04840 [Bradyrhizobium sp. 157]|uniref:hypothetical protein n=1 Tax=Bradyrhizobium sp. 157 TaxID=2782631 RepID=UPI001FFA03A3|nr:hypothetical protein [Bradyrhizobium sp. 157]MCK1636925.1 hypothetical protein [Bradyrhizobium sp. 157]